MPGHCRASLLLFILFGRPRGVLDGYLGSSCCTSSGISRLGRLPGGDAFRGSQLANRRCLGNRAFLRVAHLLDQRRQFRDALGQFVDVSLGWYAEA